MIKTKNVVVAGKDFVYTYSDAGFYITRDGVLYENAYDPVGTGRTYEETSEPIEVEEAAEDDD